MFFAAVSRSVWYYVLGFIAGISMIVRGVMQLTRRRAEKARTAQEAAAAEATGVEGAPEERAAGETPPVLPPPPPAAETDTEKPTTGEVPGE
jgi:predicted phage tail protein